MVQVYELRITYLAGNAEIAVLKGSQEVGVERFSGKVCGGLGYRRMFHGEVGLTAELKSGECSFDFRLSGPKDARITLTVE
ncbi:hypothetical protein P4126_00315 [Pseudomonas aeruginosa]|nr:hypothetical protein [Pseudomonas aeruginosa]